MIYAILEGNDLDSSFTTGMRDHYRSLVEMGLAFIHSRFPEMDFSKLCKKIECKMPTEIDFESENDEIVWRGEELRKFFSGSITYKDSLRIVTLGGLLRDRDKLISDTKDQFSIEEFVLTCWIYSRLYDDDAFIIEGVKALLSSGLSNPQRVAAALNLLRNISENDLKQYATTQHQFSLALDSIFNS